MFSVIVDEENRIVKTRIEEASPYSAFIYEDETLTTHVAKCNPEDKVDSSIGINIGVIAILDKYYNWLDRQVDTMHKTINMS
ncbi:MAG: hypothetical protein ACOC3V_03840, partial [bacterium]